MGYSLFVFVGAYILHLTSSSYLTGFGTNKKSPDRLHKLSLMNRIPWQKTGEACKYDARELVHRVPCSLGTLLFVLTQRLGGVESRKEIQLPIQADYIDASLVIADHHATRIPTRTDNDVRLRWSDRPTLLGETNFLGGGK